MRLSSSTSKTKSMSKRKTPSFVCEIPLVVTRKQERVLNTRFEAARHMYNALLCEAMKRLRLMQQSKEYQSAKAIPHDQKEERRAAFHAVRLQFGFTEYQLSQYATVLRQSWLGHHVGSHLAQKLATRAFTAASQVSFGKAKKVRFKSKRGLHSIEGKSNDAILRWRTDHLKWDGLTLPMRKCVAQDPVILHGLNSKVKYVRLVRRTVRGKTRYYAQLVCEGSAYQKPQRSIGTETVGLDIGPSTIAIVGDTTATLTMFCEEVARSHKEIRRLQRKQDRQRRANTRIALMSWVGQSKASVL
ncbi:hypothetical protein [Effusibacillus consociatus]|uniref:Transposase n=1 Tax=Effusibacillus consociatus TaxID=1117041 RepID=A0ABV9QA71_9BACL